MCKYITFAILTSIISINAQADLSLEDALESAFQQDNWHQASLFQERSLRSQAVAAGQLPDPAFRVALANMPLDTFDFNQENMTQLQLGVSQVFPRGETLKLKQLQIQTEANKGYLLREHRRALLKREVSKTWLGLQQAWLEKQLLQENSYIFSELVAISRANYRSGKARRFEVLDAELQQTRLRERIVQIEKSEARQWQQLLQWIDLKRPEQLVLTEYYPKLIRKAFTESEQQSALINHPLIRLQDQEFRVKEQVVKLADEAYKPEYKMDASYSYRDEMDNGRERSDLFSVALTVKLPLFPEKRQDQNRKAAIYQREAIKETRQLELRQLKAGLEMAMAELAGLQQSLTIYDQQFLKQLADKRRSAMQAYAAADARFNEVAMAAVAELEARLQRISLRRQRANSIVDINYFLAGLDPQVLHAELIKGATNE